MVGFGIARLYEALMENTSIQARAFRDLTAVAEWLAVPIEILKLEDVPVPSCQKKTPKLYLITAHAVVVVIITRGSTGCAKRTAPAGAGIATHEVAMAIDPRVDPDLD